MSTDQSAAIVESLTARFGDQIRYEQPTLTGMPVLWVSREALVDILEALRRLPEPFEMLYDLTAIDERMRSHRDGLPAADFTVVYQLLSVSGNRDFMLKVALSEHDLTLPTAIPVYPNADWYEREVWDMFGIRFAGHPNLRRILMPPTWNGHPLRKDHHARATEFDPYTLTVEGQDKEQQALQFVPEDWGMKRQNDDTDFMFLNLGPNHPSAHGAFRLVLQLDGEEVLDCVPDIGYHHRGAEKMAERQSWHSFIPYTDRIDYVGGVMNNLPYVLAVEKLAGIQVNERIATVRVMMSELFRITSHLLFLGTYLQDLGAMSPVFFTFTDRQKAYTVIEGITGFRMHPAWFRIGGLMQDLPEGWDRLMQEFVDWMPARLREYERTMMENSLVRDRTRHVAAFDTANALAWGVTGPNLRATGCDFDLRKKRPYSGYENFEFDVPLGTHGDAFDRGQLRIEEMRQSLRIIQQCIDRMPEGDYKADHPLTTPPPRDKMLQHIETLITHFLQVSWGPVLPANESLQMVEATKGINSYYLTSDHSAMSYRTRIRTPSFPHLQQIPALMRGGFVPDLIAHLGSIDFVMADVDR
ncbi:NADH-quinone oxidoreductase subunit C/D [Vreelandella subglaciescola]|jgi:NADH-quinone oxidoreductase subunit C/D|uniref:NADH-quinone oxidoreductase subunit C/D n=1 Tax=Vreelandella subglaciescola TaxID=29571 RepID=A0A1M7IMJ1_9GAMM|nr:NADH-quinone oxidoreductase subunit C/D [Halomonas subglaciescola]SHM41808.1 NADH dehydrogenase subunit C /NADH dehydrogenase subunit D [Halomonas subglaciescola]